MTPPQGERAEPRVALLERRGRFLVAEPFFGRGPRPVVEPRHGAREGDLVLLADPTAGGESGRGRQGSRGRARAGGRARIARVIGRPAVARDVLEALMLERGLERGFRAAVDRDAEAGIGRAAIGAGARRDLRDLPTFTIDPVRARDFDDAISAEPRGDDAWRIWVHIADVSAHVAPGSLVDREARRRATSVYVPGAVEPMLPAVLSNEACSLVPGEERLAVTVELDLDGPRLTRVAFMRTRIRSDVRLDYDRVDRIFAGTDRAEEPWAAALAAARAAARALGEVREQAGALAISADEAEFGFDETGHVVETWLTPQTESHRLIEHLMIAANEAVATRLSEARVPALYRVHERPEPLSVARLAAQLASLDVPTPPIPDPMSPSQAAELAGELSRRVEAHVRRNDGRGRAALTSLVLRSLRQAYYSRQNLGHAGLRSPRYCHFTSPIRRYPDLVCHRGLLSSVGGEEEPAQASGLAELGSWCSTREREAMAIERDAADIVRCFLLERDLNETGWERDFEGEVVGLIGAGAFVAFGDGYEGFLPVRRLRDDWWELDEVGTMLHGTRTGRALRLGDPVTVEVGRVDAPRGRVDLLPVAL